MERHVHGLLDSDSNDINYPQIEILLKLSKLFFFDRYRLVYSRIYMKRPRVVKSILKR